MSDPVREESPLIAHRQQMAIVGRSGRTASVQLFERALLGYINLRGDGASTSFLAAVEHVLGASPPVRPNTFLDGNATRVCWLGPNEWLVLCAGEAQASTADALRSALKNEFSAVTETGSGLTIIGIAGVQARDVIVKGCSLDLHPHVFATGSCAQSVLARASVTILKTSDAPCFELIVRRSFADYAWRWVNDAASEYDFTIIQPTPWPVHAMAESAT